MDELSDEELDFLSKPTPRTLHYYYSICKTLQVYYITIGLFVKQIVYVIGILNEYYVLFR